MSVKVSTAGFADRKTGGDSSFRAMLVYEGYPTGIRAMDTYQFLLSQFENEFDFHISVWRFDVLQGSRIIENAVRDAVEANAIILATNQRELPAAVRRWLDAWTPLKQDQTAVLIALLHSGCWDNGGSPAYRYLKRAANSAELQFLVTTCEPPRHPIPSSWQSASRLAPEGWGLNE